jgi:DNA gyrase subunit B
MLTAAVPDLSPDRIGENLTAVVSLRLDQPQFRGATRRELGGAAVRTRVGEVVRGHLSRWLEKNPERADAVVGRIVQGSSRN